MENNKKKKSRNRKTRVKNGKKIEIPANLSNVLFHRLHHRFLLYMEDSDLYRILTINSPRIQGASCY